MVYVVCVCGGGGGGRIERLSMTFGAAGNIVSAQVGSAIQVCGVFVYSCSKYRYAIRSKPILDLPATRH